MSFTHSWTFKWQMDGCFILKSALNTPLIKLIGLSVAVGRLFMYLVSFSLHPCWISPQFSWTITVHSPTESQLYCVIKVCGVGLVDLYSWGSHDLEFSGSKPEEQMIKHWWPPVTVPDGWECVWADGEGVGLLWMNLGGWPTLCACTWVGVSGSLLPQL